MRSGGKGATKGATANARRRDCAYGLLPDLIGYNLRQAQVAVFEDFVTAMAAEDITPGQFGVLSLIEANPGLNQSDLGAAMGVDRSTVVATIDRLEKRQWAARRPAPGDRRSYALELTPQGRRLLQELKPRVKAHERRIAAALSEAEQRLLIDLLQRIARRSRGRAAAPGETGAGAADEPAALKARALLERSA